MAHGDDISPGGGNVCRDRFSEVVLAPRLRAAVIRMDPALSADQVDRVVAKVTGYGSQSLVDGNRELYDWLRNGVPLDHTAADGRREVARVRVIGADGGDDLLAVSLPISWKPRLLKDLHGYGCVIG